MFQPNSTAKSKVQHYGIRLENKSTKHTYRTGNAVRTPVDAVRVLRAAEEKIDGTGFGSRRRQIVDELAERIVAVDVVVLLALGGHDCASVGACVTDKLDFLALRHCTICEGMVWVFYDKQMILLSFITVHISC